MGDMNRHLGLATENAFFYAMWNIPPEMQPAWLGKIREATPEEDHEGKDGFVELDVGIVVVQIKTRIAKVWPYLSKYRHKQENILIISIEPGAHEMDIRVGALEGLAELREHIVSQLPRMPRWKSAWNPILTHLRACA